MKMAVFNVRVLRDDIQMGHNERPDALGQA
jgi:hypothetical protein